MKYNREYEIAWQGLKPGPHTYVYDIDDRFMQEKGFEDESLKNWKAQITLGFDKHENFFMLHFDINGAVTTPCDRCGDDFDMRLWDEFDLIIKLTNDESAIVEDDDVVFIPWSETVIDVSGWLYEFLLLSVPLQHVHPDGAAGVSGCNPEALKLLNQLSESDIAEQATKTLWKGLDALKDEDDAEPELV